MNRSLVTAGLTAILLAGTAVHAAAAQGGQGQAANPPAAKSAEQLRYEEEQRRYQAERQRHQQAVSEAEEARRRYEQDRAQHEARMDRIRRQQVERGMRVPRRQQGGEMPAGEPAAAAAPAAPSAPVASAAPAHATPATAPSAAAPAASASRGGSPAPAATAGSSEATAAAAEATQCTQRRERNRRRGRRAGGVLGFVARTVVPFGGVVGMVTSIMPVGELLGEAIAGMLDCDEQQRAATATAEAVRGGVGTTASWTSETRPGVSGSSTVLALQEEPGGAACMTVTDVVIVDGEETQAPKRLCRQPPSSRFVRV